MKNLFQPEDRVQMGNTISHTLSTLPTSISLPSFTQAALPTAEEVAAAAPARTAQRKIISDLLAATSATSADTIKGYAAAGGAATWSSYTRYLQSELNWWNANIELTQGQVATRRTAETEQLQSYQAQLQELERKVKALNLSEASKAEAARQRILNKTTLDDAQDAFDAMKPWLYTIVHVILGLRLASFVTSDLLYKPIQYRVLAFIYTLLFIPIMLPYYIYREVRHWIWKTDPLPQVFSIFPIVPYPEDAALDINKRIYGYPDSGAVNTWIQEMRVKEEADRMARLQSTVYEDVMATLAKKDA